MSNNQAITVTVNGTTWLVTKIEQGRGYTAQSSTWKISRLMMDELLQAMQDRSAPAYGD